uniref:Uncharacterized protein n=1 Tax=Sus scrofa TaxID=9823 RepID=A0A8D1XQH4_PIG
TAPGGRRVAQAAGACAAPGDAAGVCRRQQCSVERRGFRQELDSWRHKLIHCVGFESILEGLFGPLWKHFEFLPLPYTLITSDR